MKFADSARGLVRRWYVLLPGLLITASIALGAWFAVPPGYNRSAAQLMIPGQSSIPDGGNPYLYLGGLSPAADVLVRALGSENVLNDVIAEHPGIEIEISRDTTTAGPIILIAVTASNDATAEDVLTMLVDRTATILDEIQSVEDIPEATRMTVIPVTVDEQSTEQPRGRFLAAAGAGIVGTVLTLLIASLVDGSSRRRDREAEAIRESDDLEPPPGSIDGGVATEATPAAESAPAQPDPSLVGRPDVEYSPAAPRSRVRW